MLATGYKKSMRELCARCIYWEPPEGKPILCDVEGLCRFRPKGGEKHKDYECMTEACGSCEFYKPNPNLQIPPDNSY